LGLTYQITKDEGPSWSRGIRASLNVINLFDRDPPVVLTQAGSGYAAYDASNANVYGRYASFQITKDF
jgi:iron complex outermembrane receptor protein